MDVARVEGPQASGFSLEGVGVSGLREPVDHAGHAPLVVSVAHGRGESGAAKTLSAERQGARTRMPPGTMSKSPGSRPAGSPSTWTGTGLPSVDARRTRRARW